MLKAAGDSGIQWLTDLCSDLVREECDVDPVIGSTVCCCQSSKVKNIL